MRNTPFLLAILDGLALNPNPQENALEMAKTPTLDRLFDNYPWTTLTSFGNRVGLPEGQMGNSEVGHLNIGAGRVVEQDLTRINRISNTDSFHTLSAFKSLAEKIAGSDRALHLIGLTSPGGVHSDIHQLFSIIRSSLKLGINNIFIHIITDGRDRPRDSAKEDLKLLTNEIEELSVEYPQSRIIIASLIGRYFAMDRDNRWERTEKAYNLFVLGHGHKSSSLSASLQASYDIEKYDEFIEPVSFENTINRPLTIEDNDAILFYNYRADRMRQLVLSFIRDDFTEFKQIKKPKLSSLLSMCQYDVNFDNEVLFPDIKIRKHFGGVVSENNLTQLKIAETEKYPHVTYFFNGGDETILKGEERILVPSPRDVPTYDKKPEMSAVELTEKLLARLDVGPIDVIVLNFANCDMVGHTGNLDATIKAVETVDMCLGRILEKIKALGGSALVTADHGNADQMIDYVTGEPHTYHTLHPVPLIFVSNHPHSNKLKNDGALCDIAPTALEIIGIEQPKEMTGQSLLIPYKE